MSTTSTDQHSKEKGNNSLVRLDPHEANELLLSLKKPKLFTDKKEAFSLSFKTFQHGFARHCAIISCVDEQSCENKTITLKTLVSLHGKMESVQLQEDDSDNEGEAKRDMICNKNGKELFTMYRENLKTICKGVLDPMGQPLWHTLCKELMSFKPKQFITLMRQKEKRGLWQDSDEYSSDLLYEPFFNICSKLNLFNH
jgi:hypothetical protein